MYSPNTKLQPLSAATFNPEVEEETTVRFVNVSATFKIMNYYFCGGEKHLQHVCPTQETVCLKCNVSLCLGVSFWRFNECIDNAYTIFSAVEPSSLLNVLKVSINKVEVDGLVNGCLSGSYIHPNVVKHFSVSLTVH